MPKIFGRDSTAYDENLKGLEISGGEDCAIAFNLRNDERVSEKRAQEFFSLGDGRQLHPALKKYFETRVRDTPHPDFANKDISADNYYPANPLGFHRPLGDCPLVRLICVNGLYAPVFRVAREHRLRPFNDLPEQTEFESTWLNQQFADPATASSFLKACLAAMKLWRQEKNVYNPAWVTRWDRFERILPGGPKRWLEALGVRLDVPMWVFLLRYPAQRAGALIRPTILDSGKKACHFPTPIENVPPERGGHPVDLGPLQGGGLLPEYLHEDISYEPEDLLIEGEFRYGRSDSSESALGTLRRRHYERLRTEYTDAPLKHWTSRYLCASCEALTETSGM
jgi:hypothetical protein